MSKQLVAGCYARVKLTGQVGKINGIRRPGREDNDRRVLYGLAYGDEYEGRELERILPAEYHVTEERLKFA